MCANTNFFTQRQSPLKTQIGERAQRLIEEHEIVIPQGIRYDVMPQRWWQHLLALEKAIWPFAIVMCRMKPSEVVNPAAFGPLGLQHLARKGVPVGETNEVEAVVVDTKTFHCTLGYVWELDERLPPDQWAEEAALGLKVAYMRGYDL